MRKSYLIFDYFKEAFHINKKNKKIYLPQLALIGFKSLTIILAGIFLYSFIKKELFILYDFNRVMGLISNFGIKIVIVFLAYGIVSVIIESGLYNMYKELILTKGLTKGTFWTGVKKYALKFLLGKILVLIGWIIIIPFYLILGVATLLIGLTLIPIIISVFLSMWKTSLVMNDHGVIAAFRDSFGFAKRNFFPLSLLQIIHWAFVHRNSGSLNSQSNFSNFSNKPSIDLDFAINATKVLIAGLIPFITISTIVTSFIRMVFEVFFSLVIFITYKNDFKNFDSPNQEVTE
ncbi:MAG: hypothetical protein FH761_04330 [Firmicutes bacterium]|nr:hypothetical protein [Bacillota bacterium]